MDGNSYRMYVWRGGGGRREEREEVEDLKEGKEEMDDWNRKRGRLVSRKRVVKKKKEGSGRLMSLSLLNSHIYIISIMCLG